MAQEPLFPFTGFTFLAGMGVWSATRENLRSLQACLNSEHPWNGRVSLRPVQSLGRFRRTCRALAVH